MADSVKTGSLLHATDVASTVAIRTAPNGIRFAAFGETSLADADLQRVVNAVPALIAPALSQKVFYFVPLAMPEPGRDADTLIASDALPEFLDEAICHRNVNVGASQAEPAHLGVFISARLLRDTFALAFEFFINVGHGFCELGAIPGPFTELVWKQATAETRGETSQDAWEFRAAAMKPGAEASSAATPDEKARNDYFEAAFADALAIYLLSLAVDFDYAELREREYPLLAPAALADRLRLVAQLFPPNPGYEFAVRYRRR